MLKSNTLKSNKLLNQGRSSKRQIDGRRGADAYRMGFFFLIRAMQHCKLHSQKKCFKKFTYCLDFAQDCNSWRELTGSVKKK